MVLVPDQELEDAAANTVRLNVLISRRGPHHGRVALNLTPD
jgi:hypothetical protein